MELVELQSLMASVTLDPDTADKRVLRCNGKTPTARDHYLLSFNSTPDDPFSATIWKSYAPQILWLLHKQRLSTNSRLSHCNMHPTGQCPFCSAEEDCFHLFISCSRSNNFWAFIGLHTESLLHNLGVEQLWMVNPLMERCPRIRSTVITCVLWNIWKCRNAKVFRSEDETNLMISRRCREDLVLWSHRCYSLADKHRLLEWSNFFPM